MDECIPNIVVTEVEENYVVQPVVNMGIAHLVHHSPQIISVPTKTTDLHPLELEIQRDLELKRQEQLRAQPNNSVIHTVASNNIIKNDNIYNNNKQRQRETDSLQLLKENKRIKQLLSEGKQIIFIQNDSILRPQTIIKQGEWEDGLSKHNYDQVNIEVADNLQIPLTVENYSQLEEREGQTHHILQTKAEKSDSDEDEEEMEPVRDHEPDPEIDKLNNCDDDEKPNKCYVCFKSFRQKKNMYAHIRKIHSTQPKIEGGIVCPLCRMHALRQEHLRHHIQHLHEIPIEKEERQFTTLEEFQIWKDYIERETFSLFVSKSSAKLLANNQQKTYYKCHRSGLATVKEENRKKKLKAQGSNKIGATCPSAMEVTENIHGVQVIFWKTHVGHENDLEHLGLSKEDRARLTELVSVGKPWNEILEMIKSESSKTDETVPSRLSMVSKQDLRNLKKVHDMKTYPEMFPARKKVPSGRKPMKERLLKHASQELVIDKADLLLNILETTEIIAEFRPKVCLMIDNLISVVKRRAVNNVHRRDNRHKRRKKEIAQQCMDRDEISSDEDESSSSYGETSYCEVKKKKCKTKEQLTTTPRKRGRPRKYHPEEKKKNKKLK